MNETKPISVMSSPFRKIAVGIVSFLLISGIAVSGYVWAGWRVGDAIYMVVITIFGVGYGEVHPIESPWLRTLTIAVIVAGYGSVLFTVGGCMQMLIDGELNKAFGARRMTKGIDRLSRHTILCGFGRLGATLANELRSADQPFVVIDSDLERVQDAEQRGILVIHGDASEEEILEQAGINRASTVATMLSDDAINVFVTITARAMNPSVRIIARGQNPKTEKKLIGSGADKVILTTAIGAHKVAQLITRPTTEMMLNQIKDQNSMIDDLEQMGLHFDELEVHPESNLVDQDLHQIEIRGNHGFLIVGVRHANGSFQVNPPASTQLAAGDIVIVLGHLDDIPELASRFSAKGPKLTYRGIQTE